MITNNFKDINLGIKILIVFSLLMPILLVTGPFLPDLIVSLSALFFIYFLLKKIYLNILKNLIFST